ncbi:IS1 family transposase [Escherichia coli]|uniref:IS1 family transposase n=1 Tax=Escherichia coli TaxID=562 RepID=UPI0038601185
MNLQSKCNKKRSTHQLEYNFVSTQKPLPNDEYFRKSLSFSKSVELHDKVIGHYLNIKHYQ